MTIPTWQEILLPLLLVAGDEQEHTLLETKKTLTDSFGLTLQERQQLLPSGVHRVFDNRVEWAKAYLIRGKFIESTGYGKFKIVERGSAILTISPQQLNLRFLNLFPEVQQFTRPQVPKVFISHGHDSLEYCLDLVIQLQTKNCDVWFDENDIENGHIADQLEQELMAREHFLLVLSPKAVSSNWVRQEYSAALDLLRTGDMKTFIPILAIDCSIPLFVRNFRIVSNGNLSPISCQDAFKQIYTIISDLV